MGVLRMPDATAAMAVVPRDEAARLNAEVRGHDGIAGISAGAQHGIGPEGWVRAIVRDEAARSASTQSVVMRAPPCMAATTGSKPNDSVFVSRLIPYRADSLGHQHGT